MPSLHGYELDCDRELSRLSEAAGELGTIRVRAAASRPLVTPGEVLHLVPGRDGEPVYAMARTESTLLVWHADGGTFEIDAETMAVSYRLEDATRPDGELRWGDRLGSTALPLLGGRLGALPLHASANLVAGRTLVICGVSGRGKSSVSAALAAGGHPLLAEDGVAVHLRAGRPFIWPGMAGALVTEPVARAIGYPQADGEGRDRRGRALLRLPVAAEPAEVGAITILAERMGERIEIERLDAARAHRELLSQVLAGGRGGSGAFSAAARLAEQAPVFLARVPDRIGLLPDAAERLAALVRSDRV